MKGKRWILLGLLGIVLAGLAGGIWKIKSSKTLPVQVPKLVMVKLDHPRLETIPLSVSALAQIKARQETTLVAEQAGYLTSIKVGNGAQVKAGDLLFTIDNKSQLAGYLSAKAQYEEEEQHFSRIQTLFNQGAESKDALEAENSTLEQDKEELQNAEQTLDETEVVAPFSGQVTYTDLTVGSYVNVGTVLLNLISDQSRVLQYVLPEQYFSLAAVGQEVDFSLPGESNKLQGEVTYVSPEVDPSSHAFTVRASLDQAPQFLIPGMTLMVSQVLDPNRQVLALPGLALLGDSNGFYVYEVNSENQVVMHRVSIGSQFKDWIQITAGLTPQDSVIVEGQDNVHEGQKVEVES